MHFHLYSFLGHWKSLIDNFKILNNNMAKALEFSLCIIYVPGRGPDHSSPSSAEVEKE
jgi:hypothetical protein